MDKSKLDKLNKGTQDGDREKRLERIRNLKERLETGAPAENVSGAEAAVAYRAATRNLTPEQVEEATADALAKLPADDRQKIASLIKQQGGDQFTDVGDDPQQLARASTQLGVAQSGGADGLLSSLLGGAQGASGGGGGISDLLENPLVKTVLAGVATSAMSRFAGGGQGGGLEDMLGGLLGGNDAKAGVADSGGGGGLGGMLGGLFGGGQQGGQSGGGLDDLLGGLLGGGQQGGQGGGGLDDLLGGLLGGGGSQDDEPAPPRSRRNEM